MRIVKFLIMKYSNDERAELSITLRVIFNNLSIIDLYYVQLEFELFQVF